MEKYAAIVQIDKDNSVSHCPADGPAVLYTDIEQLYDDGRRKLFGSPVCEEIDDVLQENDRWV